jgi:Lar family restriction alleviation protein
MSESQNCKPCPFCGEETWLVSILDPQGYWAIECENCDARGPPFPDASHHQETLAWNKRAHIESEKT